MTPRQAWARKRNWLIRRLMGAKSIFSWDNIIFMDNTIQKEDDEYIYYECEDAIDKLLTVMRESTYKETKNAI